MIRNEFPMFAIVPSGGYNGIVELLTVNGLWFWTVIVSQNNTSKEDVKLFLSEELSITWTNVSGTELVSNSSLLLFETVLAYPGSTLSSTFPINSEGLSMKVFRSGEERPVCNMLTTGMCSINQTGFYRGMIVPSIPVNATVSYHLSIRKLNQSFYNSNMSSFLNCTLNEFTKDRKCSFELDDLTDYHLFADLNETNAQPAIDSIEIKGRLTWYFLLIFLFIPFVAIVLTIACVCLRLRYTHSKSAIS